jgi:hypothetical protein
MAISPAWKFRARRTVATIIAPVATHLIDCIFNILITDDQIVDLLSVFTFSPHRASLAVTREPLRGELDAVLVTRTSAYNGPYKALKEMVLEIHISK